MPVKVKIQQIQAAFERTYKQLMQAPVYTDTAKAYAALMEKRTVQGEEIPPTKEQWKELYEVTVNIRNLAPWRVLDESERIALILPGRDEPVYIVVMGYGGMTYGIGIYPGYDSLHRLGRLLNGEIDQNDPAAAVSQHCINLYFGDREELEPRDRAVIKELRLKFRGRNEWPYFRCCQ